MKMMRFDEYNGNDFNGLHRKSSFYCVNKRIMDTLGGCFGLILSAIPIIFLAIQIKKDGGPIFYAQVRIGKKVSHLQCTNCVVWYQTPMI